MGNAYATTDALRHLHTQARSDVVEVTTAEGNLVTWDISTVGAAYALTIQEYDSSRYAMYKENKHQQPTVIIKCTSDCSVFNVTVQSSDGAGGTTTHETFAADYSTNERYTVLRLSATEGADGTLIWELA